MNIIGIVPKKKERAIFLESQQINTVDVASILFDKCVSKDNVDKAGLCRTIIPPGISHDRD